MNYSRESVIDIATRMRHELICTCSTCRPWLQQPRTPIAPDYSVHTDSMLALSADILHARIHNADVMLQVDARLRERGHFGLNMQQVESYVADRIKVSQMLEQLHAEYERRIGVALVIV